MNRPFSPEDFHSFMRIAISVCQHETALLIPSRRGKIITIGGGMHAIDQEVSAGCGRSPQQCRRLLQQPAGQDEGMAEAYLKACSPLIEQIREVLQPIARCTQELDIKILGPDVSGLDALAESRFAVPSCRLSVQTIPSPVPCAQS